MSTIATAVCVALTPAATRGPSPDSTPSVALLPLGNFSGHLRAGPLVSPLIAAALQEHNFQVIPADTLRTVLRRHRIRSVGEISKADAHLIDSSLAPQYLLTGSVDFFEEGEIPLFGISVRVVDPATVTVVWAASRSCTGVDRVTVFGFGRVRSIDTMVAATVRELMGTLTPECLRSERTRAATPPLVAITPFDDLSDYPYAGAAVRGTLVSALRARKVSVLEPGAVSALVDAGNLQSRGEIDHEMLAEVRTRLYADYVIVGTIDDLSTGLEGTTSAAPRASFTARALEATSGRLCWAQTFEHSGDDYDIVLNFGHVNAVGTLVRRQFDTMVSTSLAAYLQPSVNTRRSSAQ